MKKMFKGFGKPKYTADERQMAACELLRMTLRDDEAMQKRVNSSLNKTHIIDPENEDWLETASLNYSVGTRDIRWDLLNPGCPDLVGIRMFTKTGPMKLQEAVRNCFTAVYDRSKKVMGVALQLDFKDAKASSTMGLDVTTENVEPADMSERLEKALMRFSIWSTYDFAHEALVAQGDSNNLQRMIDALKDKYGSNWDDVFVKV